MQSIAACVASSSSSIDIKTGFVPGMYDFITSSTSTSHTSSPPSSVQPSAMRVFAKLYTFCEYCRLYPTLTHALLMDTESSGHRARDRSQSSAASSSFPLSRGIFTDTASPDRASATSRLETPPPYLSPYA